MKALNQDSNYLESDLTIVETILNAFKIQSLPEFQMSITLEWELELKSTVKLSNLLA